MQDLLMSKLRLLKHTIGQHKAILVALAISMQVLSAGCGKKEEAPSPQVVAAQQKAEETKIQLALAEQKATESEKARKVAEDSNVQLRKISIGLGIVVVLALLIGIGMGSSGRKAADRSRRSIDE